MRKGGHEGPESCPRAGLCPVAIGRSRPDGPFEKAPGGLAETGRGVVRTGGRGGQETVGSPNQELS